LASLRHAVAGAEGMPEQLIPRIRSVLGTEVVVGYGLTEIFQFALAGRSDDPGALPGVCGKPLTGVQVRLVDEDGDPVGVDEIGKVGGKWVSPTEVEQALTAHEAVWEAAVVGVDDDEGLIKPLAFVVTNVGHEGSPKLETELREYVKSTLAPYKYPRWIE